METTAQTALIIDGETGTVLLEKAADTQFPPASLAKLMTMEIVFGALRAGETTLETVYPVSDHAWRTGGAPSRTSTMFAALKSSVPVNALMRGVIVQAANDAAIILAEGLNGTESAFAERMNARARELGLSGSVFKNPTGLPAEGQAVTARDLAVLARHISTTYPDWYAIYAEPQFEWNKILQRNRNPLLKTDLGATGMATGYTEEGGYSLLGVTQKDGRMTIAALGGLESEAARTKEAIRLLGWAASSFDRQVLFTAGSTIGSAKVFGGLATDVPLVLKDDLVAYVPVERGDEVKASILYDGPLRAPVEKGQRIGTLEIRVGDTLALKRDLHAGEDVSEGTFSMKAIDAAQELAFGWIRSL